MSAAARPHFFRRMHSGVGWPGSDLEVPCCCCQEKICEESASFDLTSGDIANAISDVNQVLDKLQAMHVFEDAASADSDVVPGLTV